MDTFESGLIKLGSNALEEILCKATTLGLWAPRTPDSADPWSIEFPSLSVLPRFDGEAARLRICIATEDIVGPVRNGGIGTTYSALSELLAALGHDVTILYLKGHEVENGTIEEWMVEGGSPNTLTRLGVTSKSIEIGTEVVVDGYQARDPTLLRVNGRNITYPDGRQLILGTSAPGRQ